MSAMDIYLILLFIATVTNFLQILFIARRLTDAEAYIYELIYKVRVLRHPSGRSSSLEEGL